MLISNSSINVFVNGLTTILTIVFCILLIVFGIHFVRQISKEKVSLVYKISSIGFLISTILVDLGILNILFNFAPNTESETSLINVLGLAGTIAMFIFCIILMYCIANMQLTELISGRKSKTN